MLFFFVALAPLPILGQVQGGERDSPFSPAALARRLTTNLSGERKKVEAIFEWITGNIAYNVRSYTRGQPVPIYDEPDDSLPVLKPLNERVAQTVLRRGTAVCDGYARLFQCLCEYAGIRSEIITGYARINWDRSLNRFRSNHKWNAVRIDGKWHLLDATWASGFLNFRGDQFIREYDGSYFLTAPEQFVRDHYPEDLRWTLLEQPPVPAEFTRMPFRYNAFVRKGIQSFFPASGTLSAKPGDTLRFQLESNMLVHAFQVTTDPPPEDDESVDWDKAGASKRVEGVYVVTDRSQEWIYLVCEGEAVMRYHLVVRKNQASVSSP